MSLIPPLVWPPTEKEEGTEKVTQSCLESFSCFKKRKIEELKKEKKELDEALAFFDWLDAIPDGGRMIYNLSAHSMLAFISDLTKRPRLPSGEVCKRRELAIEITRFLYYVFSVEFADNDDEKWEFNAYQLPEKYADWKSPGY